MYMGINLNAVQKFWPVKFISIAPESTRVYHVRVVDGLDLVDIITVDACVKHAVQRVQQVDHL